MSEVPLYRLQALCWLELDAALDLERTQQHLAVCLLLYVLLASLEFSDKKSL